MCVCVCVLIEGVDGTGREHGIKKVRSEVSDWQRVSKSNPLIIIACLILKMSSHEYSFEV